MRFSYVNLPFEMVQARVSVGPAVKYVCKPKVLYAALVNALSPHCSSSTPTVHT